MQDSAFYSNGKLLLTGEYVVLDGAEAFALPCKLGQSLRVELTSGKKFTWTSYLSNGDLWQKTAFSLENILNHKFKTDFEKRLFQILKVAYDIKPNLFSTAYSFTTQLDFKKDWGLGSSSTLINNLAQWADINPYTLLEKTFGGSGYDIAAASMTSPFIYKKLNQGVFTQIVEFPNALKPNVFFVYLNQKQNSRKAIKSYSKISQSHRLASIKKINKITNEIIEAKHLEAFEQLLETHEHLISELINIECVHLQKFSDYKAGIVKSLGAWGGDFVMVTAKEESDLDYFRKRGFTTILNYDDLIL